MRPAEGGIVWLLALLFLTMTTGIATGRLGRGLVALECETGAFLSWRFLAQDSPKVRFHIFRHKAGEPWQRLTPEPIFTTNFADKAVQRGQKYYYKVRLFIGNREIERSKEVSVTVTGAPKSYFAIPLQGNYRAQKVAIADLDGDGELDFVIKQPDFNVDPYQAPGYWKRSPDTYKLEAYRGDGTFLWRYDLGWAIELGVWYSPYVAYDINGDGKAEVLTKAGEGDPREPTGHVRSGPEYLLMLDGLTGKPKKRINWISRDGYEDYNRLSRNFLAIAYLDGRKPSVIMQRGTYGLIRIVALDGQLNPMWEFEAPHGSPAAGQGAHCFHAADVDNDGKDELVIGSACIDDDGKLLWCAGLGHPDVCIVADIAPDRPGLEIFCGIEPRRQNNGICLLEAKTGKILWGWDKPTTHIHHQGMAADIDPNHPGMEAYAGERDFADQRWLFNAQGEVILHKNLGTLAPRAVWWDGDEQKEVLIRELIHWATQKELLRPEGTLVGIADILGDWREEIITSVDGELRIYTTTI
ncbi:MAG: silent information regulator protein Sir2, partial [candidate division WOR-3 bacterium]